MSDVEPDGSDLRRFAAMALQKARDAGAEARISVTTSLETRLAGESWAPSLANDTAITSVDILVLKDNRTGIAAINCLDENALCEAIAFALSLSRFALADDCPVLAPPGLASPARPLDFQFDPGLASMQVGELRDVMCTAVALLTQDRRIRLERCEAGISVQFRGVWNSLGVGQTERRTLSRWSFLGMADDGDGVTGCDYRANADFTCAGLRARCLQDASAFRESLLGGLHSRPAPSYTGPVLLTPRSVQELLLETIVQHASGREVLGGRSRWKRAVGSQVVSHALTLTERPHDARFAAATAFDADGVPTSGTVILDRGVLVSHLHDIASAGHLETQTTGHAGRALCLDMASGETRLCDLLGAFPTLLVLDRFSGNADPISGHYSGVAKSSRLYTDGEDCGSVTGTTIAGDLSDLMAPILAVSTETECVGGEYAAPYVLIDGVCVTGL